MCAAVAHPSGLGVPQMHNAAAAGGQARAGHAPGVVLRAPARTPTPHSSTGRSVGPFEGVRATEAPAAAAERRNKRRRSLGRSGCRWWFLPACVASQRARADSARRQPNFERFPATQSRRARVSLLASAQARRARAAGCAARVRRRNGDARAPAQRHRARLRHARRVGHRAVDAAGRSLAAARRCICAARHLRLTAALAGAADLNAAVYDRALKSLAEVLENSFGASASRVEILLQRLRGGAEALVFVDDGHGASCDLSAVFNAGYSLGEGRAAKEQNRMFHRGLVLCLDSLGADCHLFSQTRDAGADAVALQVARYGPALTALLEEPQGDDRQPLQTVTAQLLPGGAMLQRGQPAHGAVGPLLTCNSAFEDVAALRVFVKTALGEQHCGPDAPGFGGVVVLRPGLGIARHGDDLVQGSFSLRSFIRQRYVPLGFGVSHVAAPACKGLGFRV